MIWFVVWTVLVLGALVVVAVLLRRLWRQALVLGRQLAEASDVLARLADQVEALQAANGRDPDLTAPSLFDDADVLRARLAALRDSAAGRRAERADRAARTAAGWRAYWS